jgi:hypothetical protein
MDNSMKQISHTPILYFIAPNVYCVVLWHYRTSVSTLITECIMVVAILARCY